MKNFLKKYILGKFRSTRDIPGEYLGEFIKQQAEFIKSRVNLFCILTVALYFFVLVISLILYPNEITGLEMIMGLFLIAAGGFILFFNARARSLIAAKFNAYLFMILFRKFK